MQASPRPPPFPLRRSHLDSDTYRAVLRILSHCVEVEPYVSSCLPRLCPLRPAPEQQERSGSSDGAAALCGTSGEDGGGSGEARDGNGQEGHDEHPGRDSPVIGAKGLGELPDALDDGCPRLDDEHAGNSLLVEGLGDCEVREDVCDDPQNVESHKERPCGSSALSDSLDGFSFDFSSLMEELDLQTGIDEVEPYSDGLNNKQPLEGAVSLGSNAACHRVDAPGETMQGEAWVDVSLDDESPVSDVLPTTLVSKDAEVLSVSYENPHSVEESCTGRQLNVCDSSGPSRTGSGLGELGDYQKSIPMGTVEEDEMEDGEIPNGEVSDFSIGLELQAAAKEGVQLEESRLADDSAEKRNVAGLVDARMANGASSGAGNNEEMESTTNESNQLIRRVPLKPQKKKKSAEGKVRKEVRFSKKQTNDEIGLECQKNTKNATTPEDAISENIVSGHLSLTKGSSKDFAIQSEEKPSNMEDVKVQQKRKRGPLTEKKKEKKKLVKKRKRAETNRKLGVKRLKLAMTIKPRKVIPCSFYQKGRCQKGDSCKFSHDIIPETKSMPCTFFARGTCLKGDDCQFDHQLSKYPCHSFMSQGRCIRGDSCLFSHKIPIGNLSSATSVMASTDSTISPGKQSTRKCWNPGTLSSSAVNTSPETTNASRKSPMVKDSVEQMKLTQPVQMPKGICFLSFSKEPPIGINKQSHDLDLKKGGGIQIQKQEEKIILGKLRNSSENLLTSPEKSMPSGTLTTLVNENKSLSLLQKPQHLVLQNVGIKSCESIQTLRSNTNPSTSNNSKDFTSEESRLTDASQILEEFLFSGIA